MSSSIFLLSFVYNGDWTKKWISFSIWSGQKGHDLLPSSVFVYLPFSIMRLWFESLNCVRAVLLHAFETEGRYSSQAKLSFKIDNVLSLDLFFKSFVAVCWNVSCSRLKTWTLGACSSEVGISGKVRSYVREICLYWGYPAILVIIFTR